MFNSVWCNMVFILSIWFIRSHEGVSFNLLYVMWLLPFSMKKESYQSCKETDDINNIIKLINYNWQYRL